MEGSKPIATPNTGDGYSASDGDPLPDPTKFCRLVRSLHYLTLTRSDLAYGVCQFMRCPRTRHLSTAEQFFNLDKLGSKSGQAM